MLRTLRTQVKWIMITVIAIFVISIYLGYGLYVRRRPVGPTRKDYPVAKVDGAVIMRSTLEKALYNYVVRNNIQGDLTPERVKELRLQVLNELINRYLMERELKKRDIKVDDIEIETAIADIQNRFPTKEEFYRYMERNHISMKQLKKDLKEQIAMQKLIKQVTKDVKVTSKDIKEAYENLKDLMFKKDPGFLVEYAKFKSEKAAKKAKEMLEEGKKWIDVIKELSKDIVESSGGGVAFIPKDKIAQEFSSVMLTTTSGDISDVLKVTSGDETLYMVAINRGIQKGGYEPLQKVKDKLELFVKRRKEAEKLNEFIKSLRAKATIEILDPSIFPAPEQQKAAPNQQESKQKEGKQQENTQKNENKQETNQLKQKTNQLKQKTEKSKDVSQ